MSESEWVSAMACTADSNAARRLSVIVESNIAEICGWMGGEVGIRSNVFYRSWCYVKPKFDLLYVFLRSHTLGCACRIVISDMRVHRR